MLLYIFIGLVPHAFYYLLTFMYAFQYSISIFFGPEVVLFSCIYAAAGMHVLVCFFVMYEHVSIHLFLTSTAFEGSTAKYYFVHNLPTPKHSLPSLSN